MGSNGGTSRLSESAERALRAFWDHAVAADDEHRLRDELTFVARTIAADAHMAKLRPEQLLIAIKEISQKHAALRDPEHFGFARRCKCDIVRIDKS